MTDYRKNPEEAHKEIQKFIDKIASCVSSEDVQKSTTILKVTDEIVNHNGDILSNAMNNKLQELLVSIDLDKKLQKLHELETENIGQAWRPETGMSNVDSIEGEHLRKQVKMLEKNIENIMKESSQLQTEIAASRHEIQEQLMEVMKHI